MSYKPQISIPINTFDENITIDKYVVNEHVFDEINTLINECKKGIEVEGISQKNAHYTNFEETLKNNYIAQSSEAVYFDEMKRWDHVGKRVVVINDITKEEITYTACNEPEPDPEITNKEYVTIEVDYINNHQLFSENVQPIIDQIISSNPNFFKEVNDKDVLTVITLKFKLNDNKDHYILSNVDYTRKIHINNLNYGSLKDWLL